MRYPGNVLAVDERLSGFIRRMNLDVLWGSYYNKIIRTDHHLGLLSNVPRQGPWPVDDGMGLQVVLEMLIMPTQDKKYHKDE